MGQFLLTDQSHHQNPQDDPQRVTDNVHEDNGDQSYGQIEFALSLLASSPTQNLEILCSYLIFLNADINQTFSK